MKIILAVLILLPASLNAQNFQQRFGNIPVNIGANQSINPFNGGVDSPRLQMLDIDADGDLDLFIYDRDTSLNFYKNEGTVSSASFRLTSLRYLNLQIKNWYYFIDIDADNDFDLFSGGDLQTVRYFRNIGTPANANFILQINELRTNLDSVIISESISIPTFADINNDGDQDFFTGSSVGRITYYQNIGTPQNFSFQFVTGFFANLEIIGGAGDENERHGASSIYFTDIDADTDLDLFWGDFFQPSIYFIRNTGTIQNFNWNLIDSTYPHPSPWFSLGYNMPRFYDIDNDGRKDLFIGVLYGSQVKNNLVYYKNNGPVNNPSFSKISENYITCIEVGANSFPVFTDIDNDNDYDLFIGSSNSKVAFFRNTGTPASPAFNLENDSLPVLQTSFNYAPIFGDLNNDGKKDMLLGAFDGKIRYFLNTGTTSNPVFTLQSSQFFDTIDVGQSSTPSLIDIDNDNDLDLYVGNWNGRISYYRNSGNLSVFNFTFITNFYLSIDIGDESNLSFSDIDNDGDKDMFIGRRDGRISFYRNNGTAGSPNFVLVTDNYANAGVGANSVPCLIDINNDTDKDLFIGMLKGGMFYFENMDVFGIKPIGSEIPALFRLYQNYPNPFNPVTKIKFDIPPYKGGQGDVPPLNERGDKGGFITLKIYDVLGRQVTTLVSEQLTSGTYEISWNASDYPSGVYFYKLEVDGFIDSKKMILLK